MNAKNERLDLMKRLYKKQVETRHKYPLQVWEVELPTARHVDDEVNEEFWYEGELNFDMRVVK